MSLRREERIFPGHDCTRGHDATLEPSDTCKPGTGGTHGWGGDRHVYAVIDDATGFALTLTLAFAEVRGEPFPTSAALDYPFSCGLAYHVRDAAGNDCWCVGKCSGDTGHLAGDEFFRLYGERQHEQPEGFWAALERECVSHCECRIASVKAERERQAKEAADERKRAAAPELYAALEKVIATFVENESDLLPGMLGHDVLTTARAALAKARGES